MRYAIHPERQGTVTGTSEDADHPWSNLADNVRKKVGKAVAGVQTVTLRQEIAANAEVISLHKTNAETAICTITLDSAEKAFRVGDAVDKAPGSPGMVTLPITDHEMSEGAVVLINGTTKYDGVHTLPSQGPGDLHNLVIEFTYAAETFAITDTACEVVETTTHTLETATRTYDRFHQEYTEQTAAHTATIKLTAAAGETAEAGICRAGELLTIGNPLREPRESKRNYSEKEQLHNGSFYTVKLDIVRTFSYSMLLTRATTFRDLMDLYDHYSDDPFAMLITDNDGDDNMYAVFGFIEGEPDGVHLTTMTKVSMLIVEAV